jgi:hypothetical protein
MMGVMKRFVLLSWTTLAAIALATTSCSQWSGSSRTLPGSADNTQFHNQEPLDEAPASTTDR